MRKRKNIFVVLVLLTVLIITGCQEKKDVIREEKTKKVEVMTLEEEKKPVTLEYIGRVLAKEENKIAFVSGGKIITLTKAVGDPVEKGDLVAVLDKELVRSDQQSALGQYNMAQNSVLEAKERLNFAEDQYIKMQTLYESSAISKAQLDEAKLNFDTAKLKYNQVQNALATASSQYSKVTDSMDRYNVYADITGSVVSLTTEVGEKIPPMQPFMVIASYEKEIKTAITREDLDRIKVREKVEITYESKKLLGEVENIARKPDSITKAYPVTIRLKDESNALVDESLVNIKFEIGMTKGIWIPLDAVVVDIENFVFINRNGIAEKVRVELLDTDGEMVQVKGLQPKDAIVIKGMSSLRDGDKVELVE
jgi:RND family efflux transporter MFP subunit